METEVQVKQASLESIQQRADAGMAPDAGKPAQAMRFIVCGMPRGGTTFFGQLFNVHEDVFCYFMETSLFRQLSMFGRDRSFPVENIPALEGWLRSQLWGTLVEGTSDARLAKFRRLVRFRELLSQHGLDEPSGPGMRVWNAESFEPFLQDVVGLLRAGLYGKELFQNGLLLLQKYFGDVTARPVLGEKTPDNLYFLDALHEADPELKIFCILREPYSTLESMKRRALRNDQFFDSVFSKEVLGGIVEYYRSLRAAYDYSLRAGEGVFHVTRFEELVADPALVMGRIYSELGLPMTADAEEILPQLSLPTDARHVQDMPLTPTEHRLIRMILGPMLAHFGYEAGSGDSVTGVEFSEGVIPLRGIHLDGELTNDVREKWMEQEAELFLLFNRTRRTAILNVGCQFPEALGLEKVVLRISAGGVQLAEVEVPPVCGELTVALPLDRISAMTASETVSAAILRLESSASFRPITVGGVGLDIRDLSFLIRSVTLD